MERFKLSFGEIKILNKNLAEVIVDEGIVFDEIMVDEYHDFLLNSLTPPFFLLINKKYSYTYTFNAQKTIANLKEIKAMAVLLSTYGGEMSTRTLINVNGNYKWNIELFQNRTEALQWLREQ
ncbi:hypothetical protein [Aestuariivivens sp. NBU2969]|uniref:hypothetical protein n=1 Tax=Aestuariivivens sp. NBU2969 TaxID=2873267 RepID=UPI001CC0E35B|nr:hypothetical protein [Aestuariivivens sp. NBU2969]